MSLFSAFKRTARHTAYDLRRLMRGGGGQSLPPVEVFESIYARGAWGGDEFSPNSGSGSADSITAPFVDIVRTFIDDNAIRTVVDLGCGDFRVGRQISDLGVKYIGVDVAKMIIDRNRDIYESKTVHFINADITRDPLPPADLCIIRQVLQHLSNAQISAVLGNLGGFKHVIVAEAHPAKPRRPNLDKDTGADTRIEFDSGVYLEHPPFSVEGTQILGRTVLPHLRKPGEHLTIYVVGGSSGGSGASHRKLTAPSGHRPGSAK